MSDVISRRNHLKRFGKTAGVFVTVLVLLALCLDRVVGAYIDRQDGRRLIGREVYQLKKSLQGTDPAVRAIFLGDSVARQLFPPGTERTRETRHLTSNQAISLAGHYYILEDALRAYPNLQDVTVLYTTRSWRNNLDQVYTSDYFCGYFTEPRQIWETFVVTHDVPLLATHLVRAAFPNITAFNSWMSLSRGKTGTTRNENDTHDPTSSQFDHSLVVSPVSAHFAQRMKALCAEKGVTLRFHACPVSDEFHAQDDSKVYDSPIPKVAAAYFGPDKRHLKPEAVAVVRQLMEEHLQMAAPAGQMARVAAP